LSIEKISDLGYTVIFRSLARIAGRGVRSRTGARWQDQHTKESRANGIRGAFVLTTSTAKTMPQSMKLVGRLTKNYKVAVLTAITLEHFFPVSAWAKFKERQTSHWVQTSTYLHFPGFFFCSLSLHFFTGPTASSIQPAMSNKLYLHHWITVLQKVLIT